MTQTLAGESEVAFVNFPNIDNPGDSAIARGTYRLLDRLNIEIALTLEPAGYRRSLVRRAVGSAGTILIQGGGNFGDIYRKQGQQKARIRVLRDFPDARIIQLPQTIYFQDERYARRMAKLCAAHKNLTILLRDQASLNRAEALGMPALFCPDLAIAMGPVDRPAPASADVAWLLRRDIEAAATPPIDAGQAFDWPSGAEQRSGNADAGLARDLTALKRRIGLVQRMPQRLQLPAMRRVSRRYPRVAAARTQLGLEHVARGRVLVTNRLHGHLLACIMGVPNVLLDNSYGKNRSVFESWSHRYPIARFAPNPELARAAAEELLDACKD